MRLHIVVHYEPFGILTVPAEASWARAIVSGPDREGALKPGSSSILSESFSGMTPASVREAKTMKKSRFTEERLAFVLRQAGGGASIREVCRKMGVSEQTFFRWKKKFAGMGLRRSAG